MIRNPVTRQELIAEARTWIGTPFRHRTKVKGVGVDCVGVVCGLADFIGLRYIVPHYGKYPDGTMIHHLKRYMQQVPKEDLRPGDVMVFWVRTPDAPRHVGLYTEGPSDGYPNGKVLHAFDGGPGKVVETGIDGWWLQRMMAVMRYPDLKD